MYRPFWRRGIATEAARAALDYALEAHDLRRAIAYVSDGNVASIRVTAHLGMRYELESDLYGDKVGRYAVER